MMEDPLMYSRCGQAIDFTWQVAACSYFHGNLPLYLPPQCHCVYCTSCDYEECRGTNEYTVYSDRVTSISTNSHVATYTQGQFYCKSDSQSACTAVTADINNTTPLSHLPYVPDSHTSSYSDLSSPDNCQASLFSPSSSLRGDHCSYTDSVSPSCSNYSDSVSSVPHSPLAQSSTTTDSSPEGCCQWTTQKTASDDEMSRASVKTNKKKKSSKKVEVSGPAYRSQFHNRQPRTDRLCFTSEQIRQLEVSFENKKYLSQVERQSLSLEVGITASQVKTWYQNRRTKWKRSHKIVNSM